MDILENIKLKTGLTIEPDSFDDRLIRAIQESNNSSITKSKSYTDSFNFENLKGDKLDSFLEFFNCYRIKGTNDDIYNITVIYNLNKQFKIKQGCVLKINNEFYKVVKDAIITNDKIVISAIKTFTDSIQKEVFSKNASIIMDENLVDLTNTSKDEVSTYFNMISIEIEPKYIESDFNFIERSKNLIQSLGFSNNVIIKNEILRNEKIKNVEFIETENGTTNIVVFPYNFSDLDDIINNVKYIVDYYKDSEINIYKPNILEINIKGLYDQIKYEPNVDAITSAVLNNLRLSAIRNDGEAYTNETVIIDIIKETLKREFDTLNVNYNGVYVIANLFFRNNYNTPISSTELSENNLYINKSTSISINDIK